MKKLILLLFIPLVSFGQLLEYSLDKKNTYGVFSPTENVFKKVQDAEKKRLADEADDLKFLIDEMGYDKNYVEKYFNKETIKIVANLKRRVLSQANENTRLVSKEQKKNKMIKQLNSKIYQYETALKSMNISYSRRNNYSSNEDSESKTKSDEGLDAYVRGWKDGYQDAMRNCNFSGSTPNWKPNPPQQNYKTGYAMGYARGVSDVEEARGRC